MVDGRPHARLHSCEGHSPFLDLVQICRIWFAGTSRRSLASGDVIKETQSSLTDVVRDVEQAAVRYRTSSLDTKSCQLMCRYIAILDTTAITAIPEMRHAISVSFTNRLSQTLVIAKMCVCSSVYIGPRCDYRLVSAWVLAFDCFSFMCHRLS